MPWGNLLKSAMTGLFAFLIFSTAGTAMSQKPDTNVIGIKCQVSGDGKAAIADLVCPAFVGAVKDFWEGSTTATDILDMQNGLVLVLHAEVRSDHLMSYFVEWDKAANWSNADHEITQTLNISITDAPLNDSFMRQGFRPSLREIDKSL